MDNHAVLLSFVVAILVAIALIGLGDGKMLAKNNRIFDVQCEIGGVMKHYQVDRIHQERGAVRFKIDGRHVICSQFFVQERLLN